MNAETVYINSHPGREYREKKRIHGRSPGNTHTSRTGERDAKGGDRDGMAKETDHVSKYRTVKGRIRIKRWPSWGGIQKDFVQRISKLGGHL